jgi:hypothetical protein
LLVPPPRAPVVKREEQTDTTVGLLALAAMFFVLYVGLEVGFGGWIHTYGEEIDFSPAGATWLTALFWTSFTIGSPAGGVAGAHGRAQDAPARCVLARRRLGVRDGDRRRRAGRCVAGHRGCSVWRSPRSSP